MANCDDFAADYDIIFNACKSKLLVVTSNYRRDVQNGLLVNCKFCIGGNLIERVNEFCHLGHVITSNFVDNADIQFRRNKFIGQTNNFLCFFGKQDLSVEIKLFKTYCSSVYGCELWALDNDNVESFCCAWRNAIRRVLNLPNNSHSYLLPMLTDSLPIFDEICKRSMRFIRSCMDAKSRLVRSIASHGIFFSKFHSLLGRNIMWCCQYFNLNIANLMDSVACDFYFDFYLSHLPENAVHLASFFV